MENEALSEPIPLRGHHLRNLCGLDMDICEYGRLLKMAGYARSIDDPFVIGTYDFLAGIRKNPDLQVLVIEDQQDHICKICPEMKKSQCIDHNPQERPLYGSVFLDGNEGYVGRDRESANKLGLEVGKIYSVSEIIHAIKSCKV